MTSLAALSSLLLLAGRVGAAPAATGPVVFTAGKTVWHGETGTYDLSGGVTVLRGTVMLRARSATVDPESGEVEAAGDVLLLDPGRAIEADWLHAVLDGPFEARSVTAFYKEKPLDPVRVASLAEARAGRSVLTFSAGRVEGEDEEHLTALDVRLTLCDCGPGKAPTWQLGTRRMTVRGDRAALSWPVLYVTPRFLLVDRPVPVLVLPWLSLPLSERQSGLLFPETGIRGATGVHLGVPFYLTLGRSADLTLTGQYDFGARSSHRAAGAVKGPGTTAELRWAPAERAEGQVLLHLVQDLDHEHLRSGEPAAGGLRLSLEGAHRQDLGPATRLGAHLSLAQDPFMFRDFRGQNLPVDAYYSRSEALVSRRADRWVAEGGAALLEPLGPNDLRRPGPPSWFGWHLPALQRWPGVSAALLPGEAGPLAVEGRAGLSRYAPLVGHRGELLPTDPGFGRLDPDHPTESAVALPREAATRLDARLALSAPALLGSWLSVEPFVRGAAAGYAFDAGREPAATAWGLAGLSTSVELARRFGGLEHRVVPRVEVLAGTTPWRAHPGQPFAAYDLWDRMESTRRVDAGGLPGFVLQKLSAAPDGAYAQLRTVIENRLEAGKGGRLAVQLGQDLDLRTGRGAETSAAFQLARGPVSADALARFLAFGGRPPVLGGFHHSWLDGFTQLHAGANLHDGRGDAVRASLDSTGSGAVGAQGAGVDALFDLRPSSANPDAYLNLGADVKVGGATLDYGAKIYGRDYPAISCGNGLRTRTGVQAGTVALHSAVLTWDSPCHCFTARLRASLDACNSVDAGLEVDLSKILQGAQRPR